MSENTPAEQPATSPNAPSSDDKTLAILVHVSGLFFGFLVPLVLYLVKKDQGETFLVSNAREALNFQLTVTIAMFACIVLMFAVIGVFLIWVVWLADLVLCIVAAVKTSEGKDYRYPFTLRLIK